MYEIELKLVAVMDFYVSFVDGDVELNMSIRTWRDMGEPHNLSIQA